MLLLVAPRGVLSGRAAGCARGRRPAREPSALRASLGASSRSPARPRRRPRAPQPGPLTPFGPSGALHTGGACGAGCGLARRLEARPCPPVPPAPSTPVGLAVLLALGASSRSPARSCRRCPLALRPCLRPLQCPPRRWPLLRGLPEWFPSNVARNSLASISNIEFRSLELQRFLVVSKNDREKLRATFVWGQSVHRSAARPSGALHAGASWCFALPVAPLVFRASAASSV